MKTLATFFGALATLVLSGIAQQVISPVVASGFGQPFTVRAEFVAKANTYHDQNLVAEPFTLRVVAVNGQDLKEPVLIEYTLHVETKHRTQIEQRGVISTFEAYETLYQPGMATPWLPEGEQGADFALIHVLHIRPPQKRG